MHLWALFIRITRDLQRCSDILILITGTCVCTDIRFFGCFLLVMREIDVHKIVQFIFFYTVILHLLFDLYFISFSSRQLHTSIPILFFFNDITFFLFNISHSSPFSFSLSSLLYPLSFVFPSHLPARLSSFPYLLLVTFFSHIILSPSFSPHSHFFFPLYYSFPILASSHPSPLLSAPFPPRLSRTHPYPLLSSLSPPRQSLPITLSVA